MFSLSFFTYLFVLAFFLALLEVQIEGRHGWAKKLPTWRPHAGKWYARLYAKIMGGKELTGYHAAIFGFVLALLHFPFFPVRNGRGKGNYGYSHSSSYLISYGIFYGLS